ncbi:rifin PIR protein,putative [Plasmodium sp. DRC-Itaito]|nr:rifin PIR protein,putative [Plasmodium sp. DRC-Itaito]
MKLHCANILLFAFLLNILLTLYEVNTNRKTYITRHYTRISTSRLLSEKDIKSSNYNNDVEMKSVMQQFDDRTSQRLREYDERMQDKRQKRNEQREKNIQEIIEKDKMEKSLEEKIEKGCLRCGCGLGGVAASVGLFGGLGTYGWKTSATTAAIATAEKVGAATAKAEGDAAGVKALIDKLYQTFHIKKLLGSPLKDAINPKNYCNADLISKNVELQYQSCFETGSTCEKDLEFGFYISMGRDQGAGNVVEGAEMLVQEAVKEASNVTTQVTESQIAIAKAIEVEKVTTTSTQLYNAIGYSVLTILIIVLVMIIIYLVLRYRRKKKMNKKAQYTKLLN